MCRNIKTLFNFDPPVTDEEIRAASLQFVRKVSGFNKPSEANEAAFNSAVDDIARITGQLFVSLRPTAAPKNRQEETAKAKARAASRFGKQIPSELTAPSSPRRSGGENAVHDEGDDRTPERN